MEFLGFEILHSGIFLGRKMWQEFFCIFVGIFWVFKTIGRFVVVPMYPGWVVLWMEYNQIKYNIIINFIFNGNFRNSAWDCFGVYKFSVLEFFWDFLFAPIWSSLSLEIPVPSTPLPSPPPGPEFIWKAIKSHKMKKCQLRLIFSRISNLSVLSFFLSHYNYHLNNNLSLFRPLITFSKFHDSFRWSYMKQ